MSALGVLLTQDQADVADLAAAVVVQHGGQAPTDSVQHLAAQRRALADAGLWGIGMPEKVGGGGADLDLRLVALAALGAHWPALAWASAHTHAVVEILADLAPACLIEPLVRGEAAACLVELSAGHVRLDVTPERVGGTIGRLDPAGDAIHVLVISDEQAWLLHPEALDPRQPLARTGMAGARTTTARVDGTVDVDTHTLSLSDAAGTRARLYLGASAIAAGLATEAARLGREYASERVQFNAPLTVLPTVRASLLDQTATAAHTLTTTMHTDPTNSILAASVLASACDNAVTVAASALQSHGGYGYLTEYGIERVLRDAVSLRAAASALNATPRAAADLVATSGRP